MNVACFQAVMCYCDATFSQLCDKCRLFYLSSVSKLKIMVQKFCLSMELPAGVPRGPEHGSFSAHEACLHQDIL